MQYAVVGLLLALFIGAGGAVLVYTSRGHLDEVPSPVVERSVGPAEVSQRLERLEKRLADLAEKLDAPEQRAAVRPVSDEQIAAAVARYMAARAEGAGEEKAAVAPRANPKQVFMQLVDPNLGEAKANAIWAELRKNGGIDDVIKLFEGHAAGLPGDAAAQVQLGVAYLQKLQAMPPGPEAGLVAMQVDKTFDKALSIDERNWDARFLKATSLSFWPPMFGKQAVAIREFETLISQQETRAGAPEGKFARTYLTLGNLYSQQGKSEKALEVWRKGAALFPEHAELREKVGR